jgi:addiction module HigA family antidote
VPSNRVNQIVSGSAGISSDTALGMTRFFGTTPEFWINLQAHYDLTHVRDQFEAHQIRK